jgi:putative FmdB family regulatory protein
MPIYTFKCDLCRYRWEAERPMREVDEPSHCPLCGREGKLVFSTPPVVPWYPDSGRIFKK